MSRAKTLSKARAQDRKGPAPKLPPKTTAFLAGTNLNAVLCAVLAAATIAFYSPVFSHQFVIWDDHEYVTANPHIQAGLRWSTIKWAFTSTYASNWHPLTWLSHALDYQLFALNPAGHHAVSVLIHALNAVLLFLLLVWVTRRAGPSLLVAALFALHPLNVESVAWVAERKNVLSTLFFLLAIGAYVRYAQKPDWRRYLLLAALFAAGLMAKPMVITLPFVLLLLDYWPLGRTIGSPDSVVRAPRFAASRLLLEKAPLLALSAASAWITLVAQRSAVRNLEEFPLPVRVENAIVAYGLYLWKMVWPARLALLYPHPANTLPLWQVMLSAGLLIAMTALVLVFRARRYLPVGWFWFLGTLVPVIGLVQVGEGAMADRYAYIPLIGIFMMIAFGLADFADRKESTLAWRVAPALCALTVLGFVTSQQAAVWESEYSVWAHTVAVTEQNPFAQAVLSAAVMNPDLAMSAHDRVGLDTQEKRLDEARRHYEEALRSYRLLVQRSPDTYLPDTATTLSNLGDVARLQNQPEEARRDYAEALQYYHQLHNPEPHRLNMATTLSSLAAVEARQNRLEDARQHNEEALKIYRQLAQQDQATYQPKLVDTLINLGFLERSLKQPDQARAHFEEALQIGRQLAQQDPDTYLPNLAGRLINLGQFDEEQNQLDQARQHYEEALRIYRQLAQQRPSAYLGERVTVLNDLGNLDMVQKRPQDARQHFGQAMELDRQLAQQNPGELPQLAWELNSLGRMDGMQNQIDEARQNFEAALKIYRPLAEQNPAAYLPDLALTLSNLGHADRLQNRIEEARAHYQEAYQLLEKLAQVDSRYAGELARVEAGLGELGQRSSGAASAAKR